MPLGCQMNLSDGERVRAMLERLGYEDTPHEEEADLLGLIACSVRQKAIDKVYARIHRWNGWKDQRSVLTFLTGCVLPSDREKLLGRFDLVFGIDQLPALPQLLREYGMVTPSTLLVPQTEAAEGDYWRIEPSYTSSFDAFVPIQNGCDRFCSFCAVPYTRGREVSRGSREILEEIERLVAAGYRSVTLLGQNVNSYGLDRRSREGRELGFPELLAKAGEIGERTGRRFRVYFTSPHPRDMSGELVDVMSRHEVLARQVHLPIQSGDDDVLSRMNRGYRLARYREVVDRIRQSMPETSLFTDVIVGFPGETPEQFERTRAAMREFAYNMAYIAMYSPRPGAASAEWPDDVSLEEKRRRLHSLGRELEGSSLAYNRALIGSRLSVLVDSEDRKPGYLSGKTEGRLIVRFAHERRDLVGRFVTVEIERAAPLSMEGRFVEVEPDDLEAAAPMTERSRRAAATAARSVAAASSVAAVP